jgi:flagellar hook assembly protein FlgD
VTIVYAVPLPGAHVKISVFDVQGRLAATLVDEMKFAGRHSAHWDGRNSGGGHVAPGIYFMHMQAGDFATAFKVMLVR